MIDKPFDRPMAVLESGLDQLESTLVDRFRSINQEDIKLFVLGMPVLDQGDICHMDEDLFSTYRLLAVLGASTIYHRAFCNPVEE